MRTLIFILSSLAITATASEVPSFQSGDRFRCEDAITSITYELEITDMGDETATVTKIDNKGNRDVYGEAEVVFGVIDEGAQFVLFRGDKEGESITIGHEPLDPTGAIPGTYQGIGPRQEPRAIDCIKLAKTDQ